MSENSFLWGVATSSHQIEGNNIHNDWWEWEAQGRVEGGARSLLACNHRELWKADLAAAKSLGVNCYRFSIEWSRLEPERGHWQEKEIAWYHDLILECERLEILPIVTLHHFTLPTWIASQGGFASARTVDDYTNFVLRVIADLGERIPIWCTINEPMVLVAGSYLSHFMPPGVYDPRLASLAAQNLLQAHIRAYQAIHRNVRRSGRWRKHPLMVGFAHNMIDFHADRKTNLIEKYLKREFHRFYNLAWLDAIFGKKQHFGALGWIPRAPQVTQAHNHIWTDFIGVNYYTKGYVQWRPRSFSTERETSVPVALRFTKPNAPHSDLGWEIDAGGLTRILKQLTVYDRPILITENGLADSKDVNRASYIQDHLLAISDAMDAGIDIRGYIHWSLMDNFEWIKGFGPRFGLLSVNFETQERIERPSAARFREIIALHSCARPMRSRIEAMKAEPQLGSD